MIRITLLIDNSPSENKAIINEHGLSLLIDTGNSRLLFDCGQGHHTLDNARRLGIDLHGLDAIVISHSHYDHASGFRDFAEEGFKARYLYVGKGFFERKYSASGCCYSDLSAGWDEAFASKNGFEIRYVEGKTSILPTIDIYQGFTRTHKEETIPERYVKETSSGFIRDDFSDEIALCIHTDKGLVVIAGCSHPGLMNMLDGIVNESGEKIYALIGGIHLHNAAEDRISKTVRYLKESGIKLMGLCHCSGDRIQKVAENELRSALIMPAAGDTIIIG